MLVDLTVKEFLNKVAGSDPVPGGGSIAALNGAIASALAAMVANLTIGKKGYELHEELMRHISGVALQQKGAFVEDIDRDSEAYDKVFALFALGMVIHWLPDNWKRRYRIWFARMPLPLMAVAVVLAVFIVYRFVTAEMQPFIYFQF